MKVYEAIHHFSHIIDKVTQAGFSQYDTRFASLYWEYVQMLSEGLKKAEIRVILCDKYGVSRSKYYKLLKVLNSDM